MNFEEGYRELVAGLWPLITEMGSSSYPRAPSAEPTASLAIRFDLQEIVYSRDTRHLLRFGFDSGFLLAALDGAS